jgi:HD-like signal output (HDOD) protein
VSKQQILAELAAQAASGHLVFPTSVNSALRLQWALDEPSCHVEEAVRLIHSEPQLAARTVALANSPAFSSVRTGLITGVRAAVLRLGYRSLHSLVASLVVRQFGSRIRDAEARRQAERLWSHTAHVAALAPVLAREVTGADADTAMFAAILHEVGGFYLLAQADRYPGLLEGIQPDWNGPCEAAITEGLLRTLRVPEPVREAILDALPREHAAQPGPLAATLVLAKALAPVASPLAAGPVDARGLDLVLAEQVVGREMGQVQAMYDAWLV